MACWRAGAAQRDRAAVGSQPLPTASSGSGGPHGVVGSPAPRLPRSATLPCWSHKGVLVPAMVVLPPSPPVPFPSKGGFFPGSVLREGPCGELASIAPAYHRPRSGGGAGTPICPTRGAARSPPPPDSDCRVRGLTEVWVGSVLREGPRPPIRRCEPVVSNGHRKMRAAGASCLATH